MITTEKEAENKWCPYTMKSDGGATSSYNRNGWGEPAAFCIGSSCMAWRWVQDPLVGFIANGQQTNTKTEYGYCGLAGKI